MRPEMLGLVVLVSVAEAAPRVRPAAATAAEGDGAWVAMAVEEVYQLDGGASHVVLLRAKGDGRVLPIWIGENEALAISLRLARQHPPRPLTHDLLERLLAAAGVEIVKIRIEELREATFLGRVFLRQGGKVFDLDARPSDSIALALGAGAPIFAARKVLEEAGLDGKALQPPDGGGPPPNLEEILRRSRPGGKGTSI